MKNMFIDYFSHSQRRSLDFVVFFFSFFIVLCSHAIISVIFSVWSCNQGGQKDLYSSPEISCRGFLTHHWILFTRVRLERRADQWKTNYPQGNARVQGDFRQIIKTLIQEIVLHYTLCNKYIQIVHVQCSIYIQLICSIFICNNIYIYNAMQSSEGI